MIAKMPSTMEMTSLVDIFRTYEFRCAPAYIYGARKKSRDNRESLLAAQVATNRGIMLLVDATSMQYYVIGNHNARGIKLTNAIQ